MPENTSILCLETSGRIGSVALAEGPILLGQNNFSAPMRHSSEIFPAICQLLKQFGKTSSDIQQIYVSAGPGSFTGLRIASTIAKIMNLASNTKVVAIDTLDIIASNIEEFTEQKAEIDKIAVILDAKRSKFFIAGYEKEHINENFGGNSKNKAENWHKITDDLLITATEFHKEFQTDKAAIALLGEGLLYYKNAFSAEKVIFLDEKCWEPQAKNVHKLGYQKALLGQFENPVTLSPIYLRQPV